jgi:CRP/FNR family transcriptional regulator
MRTSPHGFEFFEGCLTCKWRMENFFCNLGAASLRDFDARSYTTVYPQGAILFAEGQPPRGIHMLCRGSAKLSISSGDGKTLIAHIAQPGEVLGLSSVLTANPYKSTAETLEPSQVDFIRRDDFLRLIGQHHDACSNAVRQLSEEREADTEHIRALGLAHSAAEKLANLILSWCNAKGKEGPDGIRVQLLMTHEDISQLIGTSRETVTRLLKEFRDKKIMSIRGSAMTVHNRAALEALVLL